MGSVRVKAPLGYNLPHTTITLLVVVVVGVFLAEIEMWPNWVVGNVRKMFRCRHAAIRAHINELPLGLQRGERVLPVLHTQLLGVLSSTFLLAVQHSSVGFLRGRA